MGLKQRVTVVNKYRNTNQKFPSSDTLGVILTLIKRRADRGPSVIRT